jgi:hypothetical protein
MRKPDRRMTQVWKRLAQAYGARLADTHGTEMPDSWVEALDVFTDEQLAYGVRHVIRESVNHPPTLGLLLKGCAEMPMAQMARGGPSLQEQLCAYVMLTRFPSRLDKTFTPDQSRQTALPWTYLYRDWVDPERPKGVQRCQECTGVLVPAAGALEGFRVNVMDMLADTEGHQRAMRSFKPGPLPRPQAVAHALQDGEAEVF